MNGFCVRRTTAPHGPYSCLVVPKIANGAFARAVSQSYRGSRGGAISRLAYGGAALWER